MSEQTAVVGVLALQGDVQEHEAAFEEVGIETSRVRRPADLDDVQGVVLPGGESTTLSLLLDSSGLYDSLSKALAEGLPVFGTCAGLILLARDVEDGRADQRSFGALDCTVRRNGYGTQRYSFEGTARSTGDALGGSGATLPAVFIRAPRVTSVGPGIEVLATDGTSGRLGSGGGEPIVVRQGDALGATFHPELTADRRLHRLFAQMVLRRAHEAHW